MTLLRPRLTKQEAGLRAVAAFEFLKGLLVLAIGFGLVSLVHKDVGDAAERVVRSMHLNPEHHLANVFIDAAYRVTDARLWAISALAFAYTALRFTEAYGLWHERAWAEWFALISGSLYLPWELFELARRATPLRWTILMSNILIVVYMAYLRYTAHRRRQRGVGDY